MGRAALILVGASIGVLVGIGVFMVLDEDPGPLIGPSAPVDSPFPAVDHDEQAAADLITAWERWRTATFYARGTWERRLDGGGAPLRGTTLTVQAPPRRTVVRLGSLVELVDGSTRTCDAEIEGAVAPACVTGAPGLSYEERVEAELGVVTEYVTGETRPFDVGGGRRPGCYRVENRALLAAAPWGLWAEFCFDEETGAMEWARIRRATATDTEIVVEIRADVTDDDFVFG